MSKHSDKALTTLTAMATTPEQWKHCDVLWKLEMREVPGLVRCPDCLGGKVVLKDEAGEIVKPPETDDFPPKYEDSKYDYYAWQKADRQYTADVGAQVKAAGGHWDSYRGNCSRCVNQNRRARMYGYCTGKVPGMVMKEVGVGYVQWPAGVTFDSRYHGGRSCGLCNKSVYASNLLPVTGTGDDGNVHGMWVGCDCAKKFLPGVHTYQKKKDRPELVKKVDDLVFDQAGGLDANG